MWAGKAQPEVRGFSTSGPELKILIYGKGGKEARRKCPFWREKKQWRCSKF